MSHVPGRPPSVADVARLAGVSKATAARVLGGYGTVSDVTRGLVEAAAVQVGYRPNELARSMTTGRSATIGVVVGDIGNPFFAAAVRGIGAVARIEGFDVILASSDEDPEAERAAVQAFLARQVEGLIVSPASLADITHLRDIGRPLALLDRAVSELEVDTVTADDRAAAERVTRLLLDRGHRRIAYLTACSPRSGAFTGLSDIVTGSVRQRIEGFVAACERVAGAAGRVVTDCGTPEATRRLAAGLLAGAEQPTAIIASDSLIGLEVFKVSRELGLSLPEALSLVAFHDADWASVASPAVTVVRQPALDLGETAARLLIARLKGNSGPPRHVTVPTTLIMRDSVGPLRRPG